VSPIAATAITGFGLVLDPSGQYATSSLVTGNVFAADYSAPTPSVLTTAIGNMESAYTDAAGRATSGPSFLNLASGNLNGEILTAGVYTWSTPVTITDTVTISGDLNAVWIFQIAGTFDLATGANISLSGGAQAQNIFWQTTGANTLGAGSHFEGILLAQTSIALQNAASVNGNLYAQTAITLDNNAIVPEPATWTLLMVGLGAVAFVHRKRTRSRK